MLESTKYQGLNSNNFDGYEAQYIYKLNNEIEPYSIQMTCFGFDDDDSGYFCVKVMGGSQSDSYQGHNISYVPWYNFENEKKIILGKEFCFKTKLTFEQC